ncbi:cyclodeaminase/cyclohydrolase family protein [Caballeronia novacaledonica]|uniref:Cyclodeaminase/cyclohydrolase domain-containing protein n=1 Tax=Caballeronia novacaledonica TaxID=1544861 RepID=A0AA37IPY4_9BURK|nr:cyclodeaminase/cyclohydrolase family protein [Caballeronia novacaledonica]GJH30911.1 hypothetical protein CBA19CS42_40365 [Caballeronia novacaledonica]
MDDLLSHDTALLAQPANQLLDAFGAGQASPGSGSAAAMYGLLAVKLIRTVCLKSLEKTTDREIIASLGHILKQLEATEPALVSLFEKDAREFHEIVRLRMERDAVRNPDERSVLARRANELLETATDNTFEIVDLCLPLINHGVTVFEYGWKAVRGDSGAAISGAIAAVTSGLFIVNLNIKGLKGRNYAMNNINRCAQQSADLQLKHSTALGCLASLNFEAVTSVDEQASESVQLPLFQTEGRASSSD